MEKRLLIENKSCILVQFSNEDEALAIGYTCWLMKNLTEEELNNIIESEREVEIIWPKCDILSARKMKTILKNLTDEQWEVHAVKVLGFGDWTNMGAELDLLQKNNVLYTTKQNRHLIMKKSFDDTEFATSSSKRDKSVKKSNKNEKQLLRKFEAQKRSNTILSEILKTNKRKKIDDDELEASENESAMSEEEPIIKKNKSELQTDLTVLTIENKKLKQEVAHYRNMSLAQNETKKLLVDLQFSRKVLSEMHFVCSVCHNNVQEPYLGTNKILSLKEKKVLNNNFQNDLQLASIQDENNEFEKWESASVLQEYVESNKFKVINGTSVKKMYKNDSSERELNTSLEIDTVCHNVNADANISGEVNNNKLLPNDLKNLLSTEPSDLQADPNVNSNIFSTDLDNSELVNLGYGVKLCRNILEKIRKTNDRHLLLDLLNALYSKVDFASSSSSGKKGKFSETAKPELDVNKQKAIIDYAVKILKNKSKEEIEVLFKKLAQNKCKNAGKQAKLKEILP